MDAPPPLILLLAALAVDAYLGGMDFLFRWIPHPVVLIGRAIGWMDDKLNRPQRGVNDRRLRGLLTVLTLCGAAWIIGWGVSWLSTHYPQGWVVELLLLITLLAQRELFDRVRAVGVALRDDSLEAGRREVGHIVGRDPALLDDHGVARAAIESCAENFSDGVVAPVFWYLLFGFPGLLVYKTANTLDSMIGHRTPRHEAFGMAAARFDDLLNFPPARLAGLLLASAALFTPKASPWRALKTLLRDAGKHRSINAGWPEAAMAGALGLSLAGPRRYREMVVEDPWINKSGTAQATPDHIRQALYLYAVACLLNGLLVLGALVFTLA
ncbi:adenosylcobinamide-phosphate synthase CbiB [Magnetospira thiophila]